MGNAVSAISTRVSALKQEVLEKELKGDLGILEDQSMFYNNSVLLSRPDLNAYVVPGSSPQKAKDDEISTLNEEKWLCSMEENASLKSKQDLTVKSLFEEIDRRRGEDVSSTETTKKLQFLSRTYESILRMDERERRKAKTNLSAASAKGILNHISKSGLSFGLTSLFGIIKILGSKEPELYNIILESASNIVSELPPMGLNETDPSIAKILSSVLSFFNSFVRREFSGITDEHVNATYSILFGLYIATGNLGSALALSLTFLNLDPQNDNSPILKSIFQGLRSFKAMTEQKLGCTDFSWNTKKIGKHLKLPEPNDPGFLIRDNSDGWGTIMSEEEYTEGKVYFEMTWVEGATDYIYFGINNGMVTDLDASVPDGATNFAVSIKPTGGVYKNSTEKYNFQKFAPGDKVGVLLDMDYKRVTFYVNGVVDPKGPFEEELPEKVRLFLTSGGIMKMKFVINPEDMPSSVRPLVISEVAEVNPEDLPFLERALLDEEASEEFLKINPMEISKFIMQRFDSINSKFLEKLENREKSFPVEKRMGLTLDVQDETVDILDKLMITCSQYIKAETTDKQSKAGYLEILTYTSRMMRAHLTASELATGAILDQELRFRVMKTNTDIMNDLPNTLASEEATKTTSSCFSVFYKDPQEKLEYLNGRLEDQMNKVQISGIQKTLEDRIFLEMARPDKLFPALELINEKSQSLVEDYFHKLTEISSEVSKKLVIGEETSTGTLKLLETSQIALFGQAAKANFKGKWQDILLRYTLGVFENCQEVIQIIKEKENGGTSLTDEMTEIVKNTILGNLLESLLYLLMLTKMNIDFLAKVLPVLQSITTALQTFEAKPKVLVKGTALVAESYESTHPYDNSLDISYKVEIPGAKKYYLAFDPQFKTEKNCDYLELWKEEAKINKIMRFDGEDFPRERLEVENPQLFFSFHSDGSVNYWGWKIDIFGEVEADYYAKQWPDTTKDASGILLGFISIKLISGDFEMSQEDEKIKAVLQSPLLKYGIHDKVLGIAKPLSPIPESLIKLASVPGIGEKIRPKFLNQFIMSDPSKKIVVNSKNDLTIQEYFDSYAKIQTIKYSENQFIREFIEGIGNYASQWNELRSISGATEEDIEIGGLEFDKAERAIFSVYAVYFEIVETFKNLLADPSEIGTTIKYLVSHAIGYRKWAKNYIEKLKETVGSVSFDEIAKDVESKCALLINSEHSLGLSEIGVSKVMKNLLSTVAAKVKAPVLKKKDSKWIKVKEGVQSVSSLVSSLGKVIKLDEMSEDVREINKVSEHVLSLLEAPVSSDKIVDALEKRRAKAIARTLGLSSINNLMSLSFRRETGLIRSFVESLKTNNVKGHYWEGIEGIDPNLLRCVQKSFYSIYNLLQRELVKSKGAAFDKVSISHYLVVLDALSFPFKEADNHLILEQQFPIIINILLNWSKGHIGEELESKSFLKDGVITSLQIIEEENILDEVEKILLETKEGGQSLYLVISRGGTSYPLTDFQVTGDNVEGCEKVGQFERDGETKGIYIKRREPNPGNQYLVTLNESFSTEYKPYFELLGDESEEDKKNRTALKERLCRSAWAAYKLLVFTTAGSISINESNIKSQVQNLFLHSIFSELKYDETLLELGYSGLDLKSIVNADLWLNKMTISKDQAKNPTQEWIRQFNKETENIEDSLLNEMIQDLITRADPAMKGVLSSDEINKLDPDVAVLVSSDTYKNYKGEFDFFRYIASLANMKSTYSNDVQSYLSESPLWNDIPEDFYQASEAFNLYNIEVIMKNIANKIIPRKEKSFTHYIQLFDKSETKGIVPKDSLDSEVPNEFLNSSGNLDFYVAMHAIAKDQNKFFNYYHEVKTALQIYDDLPVSCEEIYNERKGSSEYITSILWTVYACLTSGSTVTILARAEYMEELLKITFLSKSESNFSLGSRILKAIIATQHSPQTLSAIWDKLPNINTNDSKVDFIEFLLRRIGKSVYWYGYKDSTKRLFRLGYEAYGLLLSLMNVDRWKVEIVTTILSGLKEASESLKLGKVLSQHTIGSIKILSSLVKGSSFFDRNLIEFVTANVNHAANKAIIKSIDGDNVICYASTTDEVFTIPKSDVIKISLPAKVDVLELLTQDEIHALQVSTAEVWFSLEQSVSAPLSIRAERVASIRILYSQLENVIVNVISSILFKKSSVSENEVVDLLRVIMKNAKNTGRFVGKLERELLIREILKTMAEQPIFEDFTDEEIAEKFSSLGITAKNIVEELLKENFPVMKLAKCIDRGIKDKNSILSFVDESDEKKSDLLFKLNQLELKDFTVTDVSEQADLYQNSTAQLVIENKNYTTTRKEITTQPELSYFRKPKQFIKELTILAVLEATAYKNQVHFGLKLGNLEIAVSTNSGRPNFEINGNCLCEVKINEQLAIRVHVDPNGSITVINDNQKESLEIQDSSVFNGLRMGAYGLFMNTGERSSLMIFEVYEGKYTGAVQSKPVKPKDADNFKQVKVNVRDENLDKFRLKLLGLTDDQVNDTLSNSQDLRSGLDYVSKHYPNHFQNALTSLNQDAITDVRFVKTNREVPNGFTVVPVLEEGKIKEFNIPRKMMLIFKREQVTTGKVISKIIIGREETEFTDIGDFDLEEPNPMTHVWTKQVDFEKDSGLKDLIYIKSTSMYNVKVPFGYTLLSDKEGNIVNLAHNIGKKNFMFLAVKSGDTILNVQLNAMKKQLKHSVSFGIVDDFEIVQAEGKIDDNIFESQSIQELFNHYFEFSELDKQISYKNLTLSLIKKCPIVLTSIAQEYSISKLFDFLGQDLNKISKEVDSNIKTDNPIFREKILRDSLAKLLKSLIGDGGSCGPLLPIMIESPTHPYECNLDIDLEIKIPGASSLKIVFDPQTHTESGCDPLRFYKSSGRVEELKCLSGSPGESSWPTFEVEGDTVHMYFHSDGSVVYWGYKFDVIPIGGSGKGQGENPAPALWVFEKLAGLKQLPQDIVEIVSGKVVQPLFLCGIGAADFNQKLDAVNILRKVIRDQKGPPFKNILNMLMIQMNELHKECINSKNENKLLQALTNLMEETSQRFQLAGEELWFMEFCELVSDIKGLAQKDGFLDTLLFESFKKDINCSLDKVYESSHPYIRKTKKERIQIPGSAFMRITFDSNSELNPRDGVIFSYDEAGRNLVEEPKVEVTESPARWNAETIGPHMELSDGNSQITRKKASGWGNAIWEEEYSEGTVKITFKVDSDGGSDYWYIGVYQVAQEYDLSEYIGCDCPQEVWSWKRNGEVHRKGWSKDGLTGFKEYDEIAMLIDCNLRELTFFCDGNEVFKFVGIASSVIPVVCFGGLNQVLTVLKVERMSGSRPIHERALDVIGDSVYYWIPVNSGANIKHVWDSSQSGVTINSTKLSLSKTSNGKSNHVCEAELRFGKYYVEISIDSRGKVGLGFTKKSLIIDNTVEESPDSVIYYSNGDVKGKSVSSFDQGDIIGSYIDFEKNEVTFYKNGEAVETTKIELNLENSEDSYKFIAILHQVNQDLKIQNTGKYPEGIDLVTIDSEQEADKWGYKFTLIPNFKGRNLQLINSYLTFASAEDGVNWRENYQPIYSSFFKDKTADSLTKFIDSLTDQVAVTSMDQDWFRELSKELSYFPDLEKQDRNNLYQLKEIISSFNNRFETYFYLFDTHADGSDSDSAQLNALRIAKQYIFIQLKKRVFYEALTKTESDCRADIIIDKVKAIQAKSSEAVDANGVLSHFSQISKGLAKASNKSLRHNSRMFKFGYKGEAVQDDQIQYDLLLNIVCEELESSFLNLLVPTQNNVLNVGPNRDAWHINPSSNTLLDSNLYLTFGKLIGSILRTKKSINLSLPLLFFKHLLFENVSAEDLKEIDFTTYNLLQKLRNPEAHGITPDTFSTLVTEKFVIRYKNHQVELCEDGANIDVTYDNAVTYADLLEKHKLFENSNAYDYIRKGISAVIPIDRLNLFTGLQFKQLLLGVPKINIQVLKENTDYENCISTDAHIISFWETIEAFNDQDKSIFVNLITERARLTSWKLPNKFIIAKHSKTGAVNTFIPIFDETRTRLELPAYSNKDIMKEKLVYTITHRQSSE